MWWRRHRGDDDFREEVDAHIALEAARLVADGAAADEARADAQRAFGNVTQARERLFE
jgi:hypothetical protein